MSPLTRPRPPLYVMPPAQPDVEMFTAEIGEVTKKSETGHCHHSTFCLAPLQVGDLVVPVGSFYALLEHVEADARGIEANAEMVERIARLSGGGVPKRL